MLVVLPAACNAKENKNGQVQCRPFGQSLFMRLSTFSPDAIDQKKARFVFSGNWKTKHFFSKKSNDLATNDRRLSVFSAILSNKVCTGSITAKEFENIINKLLKNNDNIYSEDKNKDPNYNNRYAKNYHNRISKALELLKFEGLSEIAIRNKNWSLLQTHIKNFKNTTKSWVKPLNFNDVEPTSRLYYLTNDNEAFHFKLAALENYYTGVLALKNGDTSEIVMSIMKFVKFNEYYAFSPRPDNIKVSHDNNDLLRSALVINLVLTMDFAYHLLNNDQKFSLTPEQRLDVAVIVLRNLALHPRSKNKPFSFSSEPTLSPSFLNKQLQTFKTSNPKLSDGKQFSFSLFETSQDNFKRWWPYDYGPYLWKYISHLNINYWRKMSEVASTKNGFRKSKAGLCSALLLQNSLGLSSKDDCS